NPRRRQRDRGSGPRQRSRNRKGELAGASYLRPYQRTPRTASIPHGRSERGDEGASGHYARLRRPDPRRASPSPGRTRTPFTRIPNFPPTPPPPPPPPPPPSAAAPPPHTPSPTRATTIGSTSPLISPAPPPAANNRPIPFSMALRDRSRNRE